MRGCAVPLLLLEIQLQRSLQDARRCRADDARISPLKSGSLPALIRKPPSCSGRMVGNPSFTRLGKSSRSHSSLDGHKLAILIYLKMVLARVSAHDLRKFTFCPA